MSRLSHGYLSRSKLHLAAILRLSCGYPFRLFSIYGSSENREMPRISVTTANPPRWSTKQHLHGSCSLFVTTQETKRLLCVCANRAQQSDRAVGGGGAALQPSTKHIVREEMYLAVRRPRQTRKSKRRAREASERRERRSSAAAQRYSGAAAQRRSGGAAAQRRSGTAAQRSSDAQALITPPSKRSSHSKFAFALVRVSCEIQRGERASLLLSSAHPRTVCCLLSAVCCSNATDNGRRDGRPSTGLAPCARRCLIEAVLPCLVSCFFFFGHWLGKEGGNRPVWCYGRSPPKLLYRSFISALFLRYRSFIAALSQLYRSFISSFLSSRAPPPSSGGGGQRDGPSLGLPPNSTQRRIITTRKPVRMRLKRAGRLGQRW